MPKKNPCSCLVSNSFVLDASHCNGLKERCTYKIRAELPDTSITLQYHMKEHNHLFDFVMLHEPLTPAYQEITCILWNLRIHYHVHISPPLDSVLRHINPVYTLPTNFFKSVLILSPRQCLGLPSSIFLSCFPFKSLCEPLPLHATCLAHPILLDLIT
jgi:hypothetical protein